MPKNTVRFILILIFLSIYSKTYAAVSCSPVTASPPTFQSVTSGSGVQTPVTVPLTFTCSGGSGFNPVTIGINGGLHYTTIRHLQNSTYIIPYTITNGVTLWGDGISTGSDLAFSTNDSGSPQQASFTVTVPSNIPSGSYTDQLDIKLFDGTATHTTTLNLTFTLLESCTISSNPTPIHFGTVAAGASPNSIPAQTATIGITCGNSVFYHWGADKGNGTNWNGSTRRMKAVGSNTYIAYELKEGGNPLGDSNLPSPYIPTIPSIAGRTDTANGTQKIYTINATVTENPLPSIADFYSDTVNYTVAW